MKSITEALGNINLQDFTNSAAAVHAKCLICDKPVSAGQKTRSSSGQRTPAVLATSLQPGLQNALAGAGGGGMSTSSSLPQLVPYDRANLSSAGPGTTSTAHGHGHQSHGQSHGQNHGHHSHVGYDKSDDKPVRRTLQQQQQAMMPRLTSPNPVVSAAERARVTTELNVLRGPVNSTYPELSVNALLPSSLLLLSNLKCLIRIWNLHVLLQKSPRR